MTQDNVLHAMKVIHAERLTPHIIQLQMQPEHPIAYQSGDYIMLGFEEGDLKPFSIASAPRKDGLIECHIRNEAGSDWMKRLFASQAGDTLMMQGPKKQMALKSAHDKILFIAGGTGFAPMRALLEESLHQQITVPIHFYWGARLKDDLYMLEWIQSLAEENDHIQFTPVLSEQMENWRGETGLVHKKALEQESDLSQATVYICGPWNMTQAAKQDFIEAGTLESNIVH